MLKTVVGRFLLSILSFSSLGQKWSENVQKYDSEYFLQRVWCYYDTLFTCTNLSSIHVLSL